MANTATVGRFKTFCKNIELNNYQEMKNSAGEIAKKLNKVYYGLEADSSAHLYIVGSVGRKTAIKGSSDLDIIFELPDSTYKKFDSYQINGQSSLLQEVKEYLEERYPRTKISGDGQVVVIEFNKYTVELVPGFKQSDNRFKYPDTHDGGSWKYTDPLPEQDECQNCENISNNNYFNFCHIIRSWKNTKEFKFGGLLIDTLVYNHFKDNEWYATSTTKDYFDIFKKILAYLGEQERDRKFWYALGSNQQIQNSGNGIFVSKAKEALRIIEDAEDSGDNIDEILRDLLGIDYPVDRKNAEKVTNRMAEFNNTEKFIRDMFPVDIRYTLSIDCYVRQDGFRDGRLSTILREKRLLRHNKKLEFFIERTDCPEPYNIYWKIRNVGLEAEIRDSIRGQIVHTNSSSQHEHTDFQGKHFVECYLVKNNVCVAKAHIDVPIGAG